MTAAGRRPRLRISWRCQERTSPRRSTTQAPRCSTPISAPRPPGPSGLSPSAVPGRPTLPLGAAGPSSTTSPAPISSSASEETAALVSPVPAATSARERGARAIAPSTSARLARRIPCWLAGPVGAPSVSRIILTRSGRGSLP